MECVWAYCIVICIFSACSAGRQFYGFSSSHIVDIVVVCVEQYKQLAASSSVSGRFPALNTTAKEEDAEDIIARATGKLSFLFVCQAFAFSLFCVSIWVWRHSAAAAATAAVSFRRHAATTPKRRHQSSQPQRPSYRCGCRIALQLPLQQRLLLQHSGCRYETPTRHTTQYNTIQPAKLPSGATN